MDFVDVEIAAWDAKGSLWAGLVGVWRVVGFMGRYGRGMVVVLMLSCGNTAPCNCVAALSRTRASTTSRHAGCSIKEQERRERGQQRFVDAALTREKVRNVGS